MPAHESKRTVVFLHVDLDGLWSIKRAYGLDESESDFEDDPIYNQGLPRLLEVFQSRGVAVTFFATGRDARRSAKADLLKEAARRGHEIANHTMHHPIGMRDFSEDAVRREIEEANAALSEATGALPVGFRSPGFDFAPHIARAVRDCGLLYDASLLPTSLSRWLRFAAGRLGSESQTASRAGAGHYAGAPKWAGVEPFFLDAQDFGPLREGEKSPPTAPLLEIPVAVTPRLRLPVHATVAMAMGRGWATRALRAAMGRRGFLLYLFHGIDLVGAQEMSGLPGGMLGRRVFGLTLARKRDFVERMLDQLLARGSVQLSRDYAREEYARRGIPT